MNDLTYEKLLDAIKYLDQHSVKNPIGVNTMSDVVNPPDSYTTTDGSLSVPPVIQAVEAVAETVANPSVPVLVEDLILVHQLANEVRTKLAGKHPSIMNIFNALFWG